MAGKRNTATLAEAINRAAEIVGSDTALARLCGVSQAAIWNARDRNKISPKLSIAIEGATGGQVPRSSMRPDLWPPVSAPSSQGGGDTGDRDAGSLTGPNLEISGSQRAGADEGRAGVRADAGG